MTNLSQTCAAKAHGGGTKKANSPDEQRFVPPVVEMWTEFDRKRFLVRAINHLLAHDINAWSHSDSEAIDVLFAVYDGKESRP